MPRIRYLCSKDSCKAEIYLFIPTVKDIQREIMCTKCRSPAKRQLSAPASKSVFTVDNGVQAKAVELDMQVIESNKERSKKGENRGD